MRSRWWPVSGVAGFGELGESEDDGIAGADEFAGGPEVFFLGLLFLLGVEPEHFLEQQPGDDGLGSGDPEERERKDHEPVAGVSDGSAGGGFIDSDEQSILEQQSRAEAGGLGDAEDGDLETTGSHAANGPAGGAGATARHDPRVAFRQH